MRSLTLTEIMLEKFAKSLVSIFCKDVELAVASPDDSFGLFMLANTEKFEPNERERILGYAGDELLIRGYPREALKCYREAYEFNKAKILGRFLETAGY